MKPVGLANNTFYYGVVEDRNDPMKLGRVRVRVLGVHSENAAMVKTEDLPWAPIILPTTSGFSGIGVSPTGIIEGTWVVVYFADGVNCQNPVVIGTTVGINPAEKKVSKEKTVDVARMADVPAPAAKEKIEKKVEENSKKELGWASEKYEIGNRGPGYVSSGKGDLSGRSYGSWQLSSTTGTLAQFLKTSKYKSEFAGMTINSAEFVSKWQKLGNEQSTAFREDQHSFIEKTLFVPCLNRLSFLNVAERSDAIQEMIWSYAVQCGAGGGASKIKRALNGKNVADLKDADIIELCYNDRHDNVPTDFRSSPTLFKGLRNRFKLEKNDLLAICGDKPTPGLKKAEPLPKDSGGQAIEEAATITNTPSYSSVRGSAGFADPNGKYPRLGYLNKPDTNRLARNEEINKTIQKVKRLSTVRANGFNEPYTFAPRYPFNKVLETESGHIIELDDTEGSERIHVYHRTGSFLEFHPDGTIVKKSINDDNEVVISNKSVYVFGNSNMFVEGNVKVQSLGNMTLESEANVTIRAQGNMDLACGGNFNILAAGTLDTASGGNTNMFAPFINQNNSAKSTEVTVDVGAKFELIKAQADAEEPPKQDDWDYENAGQNATFATKREMDEKNGYVSESGAPEVTPKQIHPEQAKVQQPDTAVVDERESFSASFKLSPNFVLGNLTTGCSFPHKLVSQNGLLEKDIVKNLMFLAENVLEPIRDKYGSSFIITSGFRKGTGKSQHLKGQAVDIQFPGNNDRVVHIAEEIKKMLPQFDQLILEYHGRAPVIHISFNQGKNRKSVFSTFGTDFTGLRPFGIYDAKKNLIYPA